MQQKKIITTRQAIEKIKNYCATREHCQSEVRSKLFDYQVNKDTIEDIICDLISEGYINEERYAKAFVKGKFNIKHWGTLKIINHLKAKGISQQCIKIALAEIKNDDYQQKIELLIEKWLNTHKNEQPIIRKYKLTRYLLSKGYSFEDFADIIK